ncbi:carbohydrate kinase [Collimonas sp. NPDC087041]|uniref:carbohydrate kinase family protein n=1 Tax=Collimonas sp. NPDC087041 TaxID=3363960 RepID=UPI00381636A6
MSASTAIDQAISLPQFVSAGEALTDMIRVGADQWLSKTGGSTWNVARAAASLGVPSAFAGAISQDWFGDELYNASRDAGLDLRFLQRAARSPLLAIVYETSPPQYNFIGDNSADLAFDPTALPGDWQQAAQWVHFGGISLTRAPLAERLIELAQDLHRRGVKISYDPNFRNVMDQRYDQVLKKMAQLADVIKVSDEDLVGLFRTEDTAAALATLRNFNPDATILLTLGSQGAAIHAGQRQWQVTPPPIEIVDTVGAGDAGIAGLIYSLIQEAAAAPQSINWEQHLRFSVACGSAACLNAGAKPPQLQQVKTLLEKTGI